MNGPREKRTPKAFVKNEWRVLLRRLSLFSELDFSVLDPERRKLAEIAAAPPICKLMHSTEAGRKLCTECWRTIRRPRDDEIALARCPAQMVNFVAPVRSGSRLFGYLVGGEAREVGGTRSSRAEEKLRELAQQVGIAADALIDAYRRSPDISQIEIQRRRKTFRRLTQAFSEMIGDAWRTRAIARVRVFARSGTLSKFWPTLGEAVQMLVPVADLRVLTVAPGRDCVAEVWPNPGEPKTPLTRESLERVASDGSATDEEGNLLVAVRFQGALLAVLQIGSVAGASYTDVDISQCTKLADAAGEALTLLRIRTAKKAVAKMTSRLAKASDHYERLRTILREGARLLNCDCGDISLVRQGKAKELRVVARHGPGSESLPYIVAGDLGITSRVMKSQVTAVVPRTAADADYLEATSDSGRLRTRYKPESWRRYQEFLQQVRACVKVPIMLSGEVLGAACFHRRVEGVFDLDMVYVVEALVRRAATEAVCIRAVEESPATDAPTPYDLGSPEELAARFRHLGPVAAREKLSSELAERVATIGGTSWTAVRVVGPDRSSLAMLALASAERRVLPPADWREPYREPMPLDLDCAATYAFVTGQTYVIEDTGQEGLHYKPYESETRSHLSIVLRVGEEKLGVLSMDWDRTGVLTPLRIRFLEELAHRYAAAMKQFSVDELFRRLEMDLQQAKTESREFDYQGVLRTVADMVGANHGAMFLRRPATGRYHLAAHLLHPEWSGDEKKCYELGQGITGWIAAHNRPLQITDLMDESELAAISKELKWTSTVYDYDESPPSLSYLGVPLAAGSEVLGVLRLVWPTRGRFSVNDLQIALAAASRLAGFLSEREETRRTQALLQLSSPAATSRSQRDVARGIFTALKAGVGDCACHIRLLDKIQEPSGRVVDVLSRLAVSDPEWESSPYDRRKGKGIAGRVWQTQGTVHYHDVDKDWIREVMEEDLATKRLLEKVGSGVCAPITTQGQFIGTLHVHKHFRYALSPREIEFIEEVARLAGPALEMAGKAEKDDLQLRLETAIDEFLTGLLRGASVKKMESELLQAALEILENGFGGQQAWVRTPDDLSTSFTFLAALGADAQDVPDLEIERVMSTLGGRRFLVVSDSETDPSIREILPEKPDRYEKIVAKAQGSVIAMMGGDEPLALFTILVQPPHRIGYTRTEHAAKMLGRLGELIVLGRQFEKKSRDVQVGRPLVLLGSMFSSLEHETRSPVANLKGAIDFLTSGPRTPAQIAEMLGVMKKEREALDRCLSHMLHLVGLSRTPFTPVDLVKTLQEAAQAASSKTPAPRVRLDLPEQPVFVSGIGTYLQTAFEFLISNALEASDYRGSEGLVTVKVGDRFGKAYTVIVEDNGLGMSKNVLARATEPFFTTRAKGTGLGLPAAYSILRCHDGDLEIDSQEGVGTKVTVSIPAAKGGA